MLLFRRISFYLALVGIVGTVMLVRKLGATPPVTRPAIEPARSPYASSVAATGIIEATRENVKIAPSKAGLVTKVFVEVGSAVKQNDPLFLLDDRESRARLALAKSQLESLKAALVLQDVQLADMNDQLQRVSKLKKDDVASEDEFKRKEFSLRALEARVNMSRADIQAAERQVEQAQVELDVLTVRAPRDGTILQVNVRAGEYANINPPEPLLTLGDVNTFQVRADVDEQNAPLVEANQPAVAFLKGSTQNPMALKFVRIEPYVIPKKSLTGDSTERVDTRVLQIIYTLERQKTPLYVGQQVDVYMQRNGAEVVQK